MCGRIFIKPNSKTNLLLAGLGLEGYELPVLNNVAPSETIPVIGHTLEGKLDLIQMRWWLHPSWSKEPPSQQYATFNARIETILTSPSFRGPVKHHRAIVPASEFVEWQTEGKLKTPFFIQGKAEPLCVAAIFDVWNDLYSCAIVTQPADDRFVHVHNRMPLALTLEQSKAWLNHSIPAPELVGDFKGQCIDFEILEIERSVNNARNKGDPVFVTNLLRKIQREI
jgi:putative SOS response-associated peptidase YedK